MKKPVLLTAFCLLLFAGVQAQNFTLPYYEIGKLYPGYVILNDGTKIDGYLKAQRQGSSDGLNDINNDNQSRVIFYDDPQNKKTKTIYKPQDLKAYKIDDKIYKTMNYGGITSKYLSFVLLQKEGCISLYAWYDYNTDKSMFEEKMVFQKGDDKPVDMNNFILGFSKKMSEYVSENSDLASKIAAKAKGYGMFNILDIINEYNDWCVKNKK